MINVVVFRHSNLTLKPWPWVQVICTCIISEGIVASYLLPKFQTVMVIVSEIVGNVSKSVRTRSWPWIWPCILGTRLPFCTHLIGPYHQLHFGVGFITLKLKVFEISAKVHCHTNREWRHRRSNIKVFFSCRDCERLKVLAHTIILWEKYARKQYVVINDV